MEDSVLELPQTSYAMALSEMTLGRTSSGHPETVTSLEEKGSLWAPPTARQELGSKRMQCLVGTSIMTEAHTGGEEGEAAAGAAGGWGATTAEDGVVGSRAAAAASGAMASGDADVLVSRGRRRAPRGRQRGKIRLGSGGGAVGVARDKGLGLTKRVIYGCQHGGISSEDTGTISTNSPRTDGTASPHKASEDGVDSEFVYDFGGYKPRGGGRAERAKARSEAIKPEATKPVAKGGPGNESGKRKRCISTISRAKKAAKKTDNGGVFDPDGRTFFKMRPDNFRDPKEEKRNLKDFMDGVKLVRNREAAKREKAGFPQIAKTKEEREEKIWVRCCSCGQYRRLPKGVTMDEMMMVYNIADQNLWFCSRNTWNLQQASCDAPREGARYSDEDLLNQVISSTRYESVIDDRAWTRSPAPELPASSTGPRHTVEPVRSAVPSSSDQYSLTSAASSPISRRGSPELLLEAAVRYRSASEQAGAGGGGGGGVGSSTLDSTSAASGSSSGVRPQKRHRSGGNCSPVQEGRDDCGDRGGISWAEPEDISGEVYGAADLLVYWKVKHDKAALGGSESKRRRVD